MLSNRLKGYLIILLTIVFIGLSISHVNASNKRQAVLILINQLSFNDQILFSELGDKGIFGAMNINSASSRTAANSYLTISAGSRAVGMRDLGDSFMVNEKLEQGNKLINVSDLYRQQTGRIAKGNSDIIFLPLARLNQVEQKFPFQVGVLGEILQENGYKSKVFGNNDTYTKNRLAPLITMNMNGISQGDIGERTLTKDTSRPYGVKTNYDYLLNQWNLASRENLSLTVFDLGDLYRLEKFRNDMDSNYEAELHTKILRENVGFIKKILLSLDKNDLLIVASPMVSTEAARENNLLAPIWLYQKNNEDYNSLTSGTTKRDGVIANVDIAPTILQWLGVKDYPQTILGQPIKMIDSNIDLAKELDHIWTINRQRSSVLYPYVSWQVFILISAMLVWLKGSNSLLMLKKGLQIGLLGILFVPLLLLITATWTPTSTYIYIFTLIISTLFLGWLISKKRPIITFLIIGLITFMSLSFDLFIGGYLIKRSFLGYDPIIGARYYGIGNEFMGIYIGSTLLFTASLLQLWKNKYTIFLVSSVYILVSYILLSPTLGTNAGGAIAAFIGTGFAFLHIMGFSWNKKGLLGIVTIGIFGFLTLVLVNFFTPVESQSHIGRALNQLFNGNVLVILQTIQRKLAMNWKLIQVSSWSKVMITSIFAIGLLLFKPKNIFKKWFEQYPSLFHGFYGIIAGSVVSLFVNDSGVVAAATMIIYVAGPILYLGLDEKS